MEIQLLTLPCDSGVPDVRMGAGPARLLQGGLERHLASLGHSVSHQELRAPVSGVANEIATAFALNGSLAESVRRATAGDRFPIILAGSCYTAVGTVAGLTGEPSDPIGVIWMDTHADLNTPDTTASGFLDGMAVSILTGACFQTLAASIEGHVPLPYDQILMLGTRDVDPPEAACIANEHVTVVSPHEMAARLDDSLEALRSRVSRVYVHVDLDVLDPAEAPANTFVAPDGLSTRQLIETVRAISDTFDIEALAFTAYDPSVDPDGRVVDAVFSFLDTIVGGSAA